MKIGLNTDSLAKLSLAETLDLVADLDLDFVEFATGNWSSAPHLDLDGLLASASARAALNSQLNDRDLKISALTCSGNPLHPGSPGDAHQEVTRRTIELAAVLGVDRVVMMSGLPAGPGDSHPNWVVVSWPPEAFELLEWQWSEVVIPYWRDLVRYARNLGDVRLCLELHPAQVVYNVPTLQRLREAVGPTVGANLDPSHLMWMGADPLACIRELGEAVYHVHAKDARVEPSAAVRTVLETIPLFDPNRAGRAWNYVTLGDGHPDGFWADFCDELAKLGYDGGLSIEHEDPAIAPVDGVRRSVALLRRVSALGDRHVGGQAAAGGVG